MRNEEGRWEKGWAEQRMRFLGLLTILASCVLSPSWGHALLEGESGGGELRNVALLRMDLPRGFRSEERRALEEDLLQALHRTGRFQIVDRHDMEAILKELRFQATDLADANEVVELGKLAGVDLFLVCDIEPIEGVYQITARLISVETGKVERIVVQRCQGRFDFLVAMFNEVAYDLAGQEAGKGRLRIETDPPEAEVSLFGVPRGLSPLELRLAPGLYLFSVTRKGYVERRKTLEIAAGKETSWKVKLVRRKQLGLGDYIRGRVLWGRD